MWARITRGNANALIKELMIFRVRSLHALELFLALFKLAANIEHLRGGFNDLAISMMDSFVLQLTRLC